MDRYASAAVMSSIGRRSLFCEVEPFSFGLMPTGGPHEIYY